MSTIRLVHVCHNPLCRWHGVEADSSNCPNCRATLSKYDIDALIATSRKAVA